MRQLEELRFDEILANVDEYLRDIKMNKEVVKDAVSTLNVLWLGEYLNRYSNKVALSEDAFKIISFRNHVSHSKIEDRRYINLKLIEALDVIARTKTANDLIKGKLSEDQKKIKSKNIRFISNAEMVAKFKECGLNYINGSILRITNAPLGASFNLERNYIILPEYMKKQVGESELKKIIFDLFGNHAMLRFVDNIVESKESYSAMVVLTDGTVKPVILLDTLNKKQVHFKDIKKIMPIK